MEGKDISPQIPSLHMVICTINKCGKKDMPLNSSKKLCTVEAV